ncbi:MAG: NAD(P)H-dependent oxidoreductase [Methanosarcinales archaeon]|nr:NAD(P)H-dependent oxidoreductase [Methanosarcinales archaeon]
MHVFIVYAHPSEDSFTRHVRDEFIKGLKISNHSYEISELYKMNFKTDMSEAEYLREANYDEKLPLSEDVINEQEKINRSDVIVFIYPVFWTEAPAKLVGWFDRVWTYGFAYGDRKMKRLKKAIVLCIAGHTLEHLKEYGHYDSMKTIMLSDRIFDRAENKEIIILDGTSKFNPELRQSNWNNHLMVAFKTGKNL